MRDEGILIEDLYHSLQHIQSDLDDINDDRIKSIVHTVNHMMNRIDKYYDEIGDDNE